jgi:ubiquinone/menaquinone biosynthesis C-methylase UbiE
VERQPLVDRSYLRDVAYADSSKLRDRMSIYQYRDVAGELGPWVLSHVDWPRGARVLDVGCGPGQYLAPLAKTESVAAIGIDLSHGMCREASAHAPTLTADAASLPFVAGAFERVLAPHMLYHCADIEATLGELRRVLRRQGTLIAVVNSVDHMIELRDVLRAVTGADGLRVSDRITLENGREIAATAFDDINVDRFSSVLHVPDAAPVLAYIQSMAGWAGDLDPTDAAAEIQRRVSSIIQAEGSFRIHTCAGVLVCS